MDVARARASLPGTWYIPGATCVVTFAYKDTWYYVLTTGRSSLEPQEPGSLARSESKAGLKSDKSLLNSLRKIHLDFPSRMVLKVTIYVCGIDTTFGISISSSALRVFHLL